MTKRNANSAVRGKSLKDRLLDYLRKRGGYVHSGEIQRIVAEHTTYTPANTARRLRELEEEDKIEVKYEKNHALYRAKSMDWREVQKAAFDLWNSVPDKKS